jgi:hypothetical protein
MEPPSWAALSPARAENGHGDDVKKKKSSSETAPLLHKFFLLCSKRADTFHLAFPEIIDGVGSRIPDPVPRVLLLETQSPPLLRSGWIKERSWSLSAGFSHGCFG